MKPTKKQYYFVGAIVLMAAVFIAYKKYLYNSYGVKDIFNFGGNMGNTKDKYYLSARSLARINDVNPLLIKIFKEAIKQSPFDFGIPSYGGKRTTEDQQYLFAKGRTRDLDKKPITWVDGIKKKSYHQSGNAVDIYAYINGGASWDPKYYGPIARHIIKVAKEQFNTTLQWGGDWTKKDLPHFQIKG